MSLHHYPFYPGTGGIGEIGRGDGEGWTVNLPLPVGSSDGDYLYLFDSVVIPVLEQIQPDLIIISAGYDAHQKDPLGGMDLTSPAYGEMTRVLMSLGRPIVAVLEGGYSPEGLMEGTEATLLAFSGKTDFFEEKPTPSAVATAIGDRVFENLSSFWPELIETKG